VVQVVKILPSKPSIQTPVLQKQTNKQTTNKQTKSNDGSFPSVL
jgi:hypothetical protein